ncbi:hypothetical protein [Pseudoalteromonas obscura]|uniref:HTH cro/C1-type domain-containing protein n=1 Tax=Pseudoalteromonas obscura TaxID=3048491 RepID=A0ABT7EUI7_9GAMM|nr:hypothetical protein [Pseudoalteromonas sp. P94(2023)]MDK2598640.1 hypothetical protein [Pseudoalteromonas sp. P94(2023)]
MKPSEIQHAIKAAGYNQSLIAKALNVEASSVSQVIHNRASSSRIREFIAKVINMPVSEVFPSKTHIKPRLTEIQRKSAISELKSMLPIAS